MLGTGEARSRGAGCALALQAGSSGKAPGHQERLLGTQDIAPEPCGARVCLQARPNGLHTAVFELCLCGGSLCAEARL